MKKCWMVVGLLAMFVMATGLLAAKDAKEPKEKPQTMKFRYLSVIVDGQAMSKEDLKGMTLTVNGNKGVVRKGKMVLHEGTSTVDMGKKPWTIDIKITKGEDMGKTIKGIMKISEDRKKMTVCFGKAGADRPTKFASEKGSGQILEVLEEIGD
jgi:uncharacterized protein (TIGR03067 family)